MKKIKLKDTDQENLFLLVRTWKEFPEVWFDIFLGKKPLSSTVGLRKAQVKRLIKFLQKWLEMIK